MTRKQRNKEYKKALALIKKRYHYLPIRWSIKSYNEKTASVHGYIETDWVFQSFSICGALSCYIPDFKLKNYPEILECKPTNVSEDQFWWPENEVGFMIRVMALERAIKLTN